MSKFALREMILQGWPVLSVLLVCSIASLAVVWDRWRAFRKVKKSIPKILEDIAALLKQATTLEQKERLAQNEIARSIAPLENYLSILGTIAATAPFIGLLGTVIGIIKAFKAVSLSMGGGSSVVANGIAEALIATAVGLMVAIPAVFASNYFNRKLQALEENLALSAGDLMHGVSHKRAKV